MLDRLKRGDISRSGAIYCEYQLYLNLDEYEGSEIWNYTRIYCASDSELERIGRLFHEITKDKKITYLAFFEEKIGYCEREWTEYKHKNYTGRFRYVDVYNYAEKITLENRAKLLFEMDNGDYDDEGNYTGYNGDYADFTEIN
jgi:hypothetical protein